MPGTRIIAFVICHAFWLAFAAAAAEPEVNEEDLRPGLVAVYRDRGKPAPRKVFQLEPTIALALRAGEAPHPRLAADGGTARWDGFIKILRTGVYQFSANLRGRFTLHIAGKKVLTAEAKAESAAF